MANFKLGTITDEKLAVAICRAMDMYMLHWELETKDGKTSLSVYADVEDDTFQFLEAIKQ